MRLGFADPSDRVLNAPERQDAIAALFWPPTRAMRADPRFLPLVERLVLMDNWRATKT